MKVTTLVENTRGQEDLCQEHGLSLYIETTKHKILFDTGAGDCMMKNAKKLQVPLEEVDTVIVSHGHYDHGGGLEDFLKINKHAKIYIHPEAFGQFYSERKDEGTVYIGLNQKLKVEKQIIWMADDLWIDETLFLFSKVTKREYFPIGNRTLFEKTDEGLLPDLFRHEINLIIHESDKKVLVAGCAHKGIVNIINKAKDLTKTYPTHVLGGFHLSKSTSGIREENQVVKAIGDYLNETGAMYYTGHCTGEKAFLYLKDIMNHRIEALTTGLTFNIK
ncbi:MBL fold metallo-hydrolase [Petrocella sp. FN5]|uniref:MBL fold metallo-hydrolase n=1 Tax=Petrocella sp. FN5 TaxID=3032002 RepID=UPI0023D98990|nr:MBL fold metallo-hydrolase [Petrocella sp. FN5]MDF1615872.1 MBL fold metallo-hydrolase [Petrocella sp. FN5]